MIIIDQHSFTHNQRMEEDPSTLECFSDELLIHLFQYFDLFQLFYSLNNRFKQLIQSLDHLHLTISSQDCFLYLENLFPSIRSLIIIDHVNIDLQLFQNVRRLIFHSPSSELLHQFSELSFPYLESLSIPETLFGLSPIFEKIFSNQYPRLKSSHLFGYETIETIGRWTQISSLRVLQIGFIDYHVYQAILSSCPNLYSLKLQIFQSYLKLSDGQIHPNLRILNIQSEINDCRYNDQLIDRFLQCVRNLEQLSISRTIALPKFREFPSDYDWFSSSIALRLPSLKYFNVSIQLECQTEWISSEIRRELRKLFFQAHPNRYQTRLIIQ